MADWFFGYTNVVTFEWVRLHRIVVNSTEQSLLVARECELVHLKLGRDERSTVPQTRFTAISWYTEVASSDNNLTFFTYCCVGYISFRKTLAFYCEDEGRPKLLLRYRWTRGKSTQQIAICLGDSKYKQNSVRGHGSKFQVLQRWTVSGLEQKFDCGWLTFPYVNIPESDFSRIGVRHMESLNRVGFGVVGKGGVPKTYLVALGSLCISYYSWAYFRSRSCFATSNAANSLFSFSSLPPTQRFAPSNLLSLTLHFLSPFLEAHSSPWETGLAPPSHLSSLDAFPWTPSIGVIV